MLNGDEAISELKAMANKVPERIRVEAIAKLANAFRKSINQRCGSSASEYGKMVAVETQAVRSPAPGGSDLDREVNKPDPVVLDRQEAAKSSSNSYNWDSIATFIEVKRSDASDANHPTEPSVGRSSTPPSHVAPSLLDLVRWLGEALVSGELPIRLLPGVLAQ